MTELLVRAALTPFDEAERRENRNDLAWLKNRSARRSLDHDGPLLGLSGRDRRINCDTKSLMEVVPTSLHFTGGNRPCHRANLGV